MNPLTLALRFIVSVLLLQNYTLGSENCGCSGASRISESSVKHENECHKEEKEELSCEKAVLNKYKKENQYGENSDIHEYSNLTFIAGGQFQMGTDKPFFVADGEGPSRSVTVDDFYMDIHEVSNRDFEEFVKSTGHLTEVLSEMQGRSNVSYIH